MLALGVLAALYRTALRPVGSDHESRAAASGEEESEKPGRQIVYALSPERPVRLVVSRGATQVRVVTVLDLPVESFVDSDREYAYSCRATFLEPGGRALATSEFWERTRKIRVNQAGGWQENVWYGAPAEALACEPRTAFLAVPAGASRLQIEWPRQEMASGSVRCLEQQESREAPGELYRRWELLPADARERIERASAVGPAGATLAEKVAAMARPWRRITSEGNPGRDYLSRYLYLAARPVEYVPPGRRPVPAAATAPLAAAGSPVTTAQAAAKCFVYNLVGPGLVELAWRGEPGGADRPAAEVSLGGVTEDGICFVRRVALAAVGEEWTGRTSIGPGVQTIELHPGGGGGGSGKLVLRSTAPEAKIYSAGPSGPSSRLLEVAPAARLVRSWRAGPATSAVNPELGIVAPPSGAPSLLRIVARAPGPVRLGMTLLDAAGRPAGESSLALTPVPAQGESVAGNRAAFPGESARALGVATAAVLFDAGIARARFHSAPDCLLAFYTQLDEPLEVSLERRARDRQAGIVRWAQEAGRRWHALKPENADALEQARRAVDVISPDRAVALDPTPSTSAAPEMEARAVAPLEPAPRVSVLEPSARAATLPTTWERGSWWPLVAARSTRVRLRRPQLQELPVTARARLLWNMGAAPLPGTLAVWAGNQLLGSVRPATRAGDLVLSGPPGGVVAARLEGPGEGGRFFTNLPPADPASVAAWRERSYYLIRSGEPRGFEVEKSAGRDTVLNLAIAPLAGGSRRPGCVVEAVLEGPGTRTGRLLSRVSPARVLLRAAGSGPSAAVALQDELPAVAGAEAAFLTIGEDRPPGRYRWRLRVVEGEGALLRAFVMQPQLKTEGRVWLSTRM